MSKFMHGVAAIVLASVAQVTTAEAAQLKVTIHNDAGSGGVFLTPLWVGFHNGSFDSFNVGSAASAGIEAIAEDGNAAPLGASFGGLSGVVGGLLAPGASASRVFDVAANGSNDFLSFAAMVLPTSDFFIGNDNPHAVSLAGLLDGSFGSVSVAIRRVFDAGTEVNDFATSAGNGLFGIAGGQSGPNQGANQFGLISVANSADFSSFLNSAGVNLAPFNFSAQNSLATLTIERVPAPVPLPASLPLLLSSVAAIGLLRRRSR